MIGSERKVRHDGDPHQIHILIHVIGGKSFVDKGHRVAGGVSAARRGDWTLCSLKGLDNVSSRGSRGAINFIFIIQTWDPGRQVSKRPSLIRRCRYPLHHVIAAESMKRAAHIGTRSVVFGRQREN